MVRRRVLVDSELFLQLEAQLPEDPTDDLPSQAQFIGRDLVLAATAFEHEWDDLPALPGAGDLRVLITNGVLVHGFSVVGQLQPDGSVLLVRISVQPYPPDGLIDPDADPADVD